MRKSTKFQRGEFDRREVENRSRKPDLHIPLQYGDRSSVSYDVCAPVHDFPGKSSEQRWERFRKIQRWRKKMARGKLKKFDWRFYTMRKWGLPKVIHYPAITFLLINFLVSNDIYILCRRERTRNDTFTSLVKNDSTSLFCYVLSAEYNAFS